MPLIADFVDSLDLLRHAPIASLAIPTDTFV
jgi:hypothetical protein